MLLKRRSLILAIGFAAFLAFFNALPDLLRAIAEATGDTGPPQTGPFGFQNPIILILLSMMLPVHVSADAPPAKRSVMLLWVAIILVPIAIMVWLTWIRRFAALTFVIDVGTFVLLLLRLKTVPKTDLICTPAPPQPAPETTAVPA